MGDDRFDVLDLEGRVKDMGSVCFKRVNVPRLGSGSAIAWVEVSGAGRDPNALRLDLGKQVFIDGRGELANEEEMSRAALDICKLIGEEFEIVSRRKER